MDIQDTNATFGVDNKRHNFFQKKEEKRFSPFCMEYLSYIVPRPKVTNMSHVTEEQRYTIFRMLKMNKNQTEIGFAIGKDKSVVSREISRNKDKRSGEYRPDLAQSV